MQNNVLQNSSVSLLINSLSGGGAERQIALLDAHFKFKDIILLEQDTNGFDVGFQNKISKLSFHTKKTSSFVKMLSIPLYAFRLKNHVHKNQTIVSFLERSNFVNVISKIFVAHNAIVCERTSPSIAYRGIRGFFMKFLIKTVYKKADLIVCNSLGVQQDLIQNFNIQKEKIRVIYNILPVGEIREKAKEDIDTYATIFNGKVLVHVGRLVTPKAQWRLLRIFNEVKKEIPDARLVILGEGGLRSKLIQLSHNLGLRTFSVWDNSRLDENYDVYFLGFQKNPYAFVSHSDIFVFTSLWEGFPNGVLEALACNIPVISSDCRSGPREILSPDSDFRDTTNNPDFTTYGILMPVLGRRFQDESESIESTENLWAKTIIAIMQDDTLRKKYRELSNKRIFDFSADIILPKWNDIINEYTQ